MSRAESPFLVVPRFDYRLRVAERSEVGKRTSQQDVALMAPKLALFVVADGMGGHNAGERASELAVESINDYVLNLMQWDYRLENRRDEDFEEEDWDDDELDDDDDEEDDDAEEDDDDEDDEEWE